MATQDWGKIDNATPIHIGITVGDIQRSVDFYVNSLGFEQLTPPKEVTGPAADQVLGMKDSITRPCFVRKGTMILELVEFVRPAGRAGLPAIQDRGCVHVSFAVPDVLSIYERIIARGAQVLGPPSQSRRTGRWTLIAHDPDGTIIEFIEGEPEHGRYLKGC